MDVNSNRIAEEIRNLRDELPKNVLMKQYELQPELKKLYTSRMEEHYLEDTRYHLSYLSEAIAVNEPKLFTEYIEWAKLFFADLPVKNEDLILNLELVKEEINAKLSIDSSDLINKYIDKGIEIFKGEQRPIHSFIVKEKHLGKEAEKYLELLLDGNKREASKFILDLVDSGEELKAIYLNIFEVTQLETGRLWQIGKISVAQEHFITAATQLIMSQLYPYLFSEGKAESENKIIVACVPGELHELGARMVADIFEMEGWNSYFFGANTPQQSLLKSIDKFEPDIVAVSATMTFHLSEVSKIINTIRNQIKNDKLKIMVGGYPFAIAENLWKDIGADGYAANAVKATKTAMELTNG